MSRPIRTQEGKKKHKKRLLFIAGGFFVLLGILIGGVAWLSHLPSATIATVEIDGAEVIKPDTVKEKVLATLSGKYYFLFPRTNAFLYPRKEITQGLTADFPRAENVAVALKGLNTLVITLSERKPAYIFCKGESECYFVDKEGIVFDTSPSFSGDAYLAFVQTGTTPLSTSTPASPLGASFLDQNTFRMLVAFADATKKLGFSPQKIILGDDQYAELVFREGWKIKFSTTQEETKLENNLSSLAQAPKWGRAMHGDIIDEGRLLYFDFRFGNKVYYKFEK